MKTIEQICQEYEIYSYAFIKHGLEPISFKEWLELNQGA
jgi:hypothetical protein